MKTGVRVKVCGITRAADALLAAELEADFLGFIFFAQSPRALTPIAFRDLLPALPDVARVYVQVRPGADELRQALDNGFEYFQIHFPGVTETVSKVEEWSEIVSPDRLWLAPRLAPGEVFPEDLLPLANTFLLDAYRKDAYGGTGDTGDWTHFAEWSSRWPQKQWILAGGLAPENVQAALEATGASSIDVNSGIEESPGKKSAARMRALFAALR
jgi:phosphoribosylanthranilate isomerase